MTLPARARRAAGAVALVALLLLLAACQTAPESATPDASESMDPNMPGMTMDESP